MSTLNPGEPATVQTNFDGSNVRFTIGIPRGSDGTSGSDGTPGKLSKAQLNNAISGKSNNSISTLGQVADGSYNPTQIQNLMNTMDELINALRR